MYRVDKINNSVSKLEQRLFKDLNIQERDNLQEWIADNPEMLGEELLIIQKEYDGFNDTKERLDLLAIDKEGDLVIIENKLDDTGRDVVWQALKYTSYCSTLTNNQIIRIYQQYLDRYANGESAKENLMEFLDRKEEDLLLNHNDQRIIFVANNYRKEVTSTVLWLLDHDVKIQCIRATPYSMGEDIFLQMEQIIPLPETQEFMINAKEKVKEQKNKSKVKSETEIKLTEFWASLKIHLQDNNVNYISNVAAKPHYSLGFSKESGKFSFCIGNKALRVDLVFSNDPDKILIDAMKEYDNEIQSKLNNKVIWERLEGLKTSRIKYEISYEDIDKQYEKSSDETWEHWVYWYKDAMVNFYKVIYPIWSKVQKKLK